MKILKFTTKSASFEYFWAGIWKYFHHIWDQRSCSCLLVNFVAKMKIPKPGTKNPLFGYFCAGLRSVFRTLLNIQDIVFFKISPQLKAVNYFTRCCVLDVWQDCEYTSGTFKKLLPYLKSTSLDFFSKSKISSKNGNP